ncbi:MAG: hypothetical protein LBU27_05245 [Candidatus Peribacteria bacterium]|nr:hypothetical protein [Candidatus Peribacteria bacterium]
MSRFFCVVLLAFYKIRSCNTYHSSPYQLITGEKNHLAVLPLYQKEYLKASIFQSSNLFDRSKCANHFCEFPDFREI